GVPVSLGNSSFTFSDANIDWASLGSDWKLETLNSLSWGPALNPIISISQIISVVQAPFLVDTLSVSFVIQFNIKFSPLFIRYIIFSSVRSTKNVSNKNNINASSKTEPPTINRIITNVSFRLNGLNQYCHMPNVNPKEPIIA